MKLNYKDYLRGVVSVFWMLGVFQCLTHIINGSSIILTGLYFIIYTSACALCVGLTINDEL